MHTNDDALLHTVCFRLFLPRLFLPLFVRYIDSHGIKRLLRRGRYVSIDSPLSASTVGSMHSGNATWLVRERLAVGEAGFRQLQFSTSRGGR